VNENYAATPPDLADVVARSSGKTEVGDVRIPTSRVEFREDSAQGQAEHVRRIVAAYVEQATRDMLELGRAFESCAHAFGELNVALARRPFELVGHAGWFCSGEVRGRNYDGGPS
jgi:hypothetical protein